jgi:hypothetical protein
MAVKTNPGGWSDWLSPLRLTLVTINAVCFGGCLVLLALGRASGPLVLLTVAVGLSAFAGTAGAILACCRGANRRAGQERIGG